MSGRLRQTPHKLLRAGEIATWVEPAACFCGAETMSSGNKLVCKSCDQIVMKCGCKKLVKALAE